MSSPPIPPPPPPPPPPAPTPFWRHPTVIGVATVVAAMAAVLAIPALNHSEATPPAPVSVGGNVGGCVQVGSTNPQCSVEQQADEASKNAADAAHLKKLVESFSAADPQGAPPWSFLVYNTRDQAGNEIGLKVRSGPELASTQIGSARGRALIWGECFVLSDFNPEAGSDVDVGPRWLRIRWPTSAPSTTFAESSPTDPAIGYVYAGYALPFNHNWNIPQCRD